MAPGGDRRGAGRGPAGALIALVTLAASVGLGLLVGLVVLSAGGPARFAPDPAALAPGGLAVQGTVTLIVWGGAAVAALYLLHYVFFRSVVGWGVLLGLFLWIPFGTHILRWQPSIALVYPNVPATLDRLVEENPPLAALRTAAETRVPLPPAESPARSAGAAGPATSVGSLERRPTRLPQIGN